MAQRIVVLSDGETWDSDAEIMVLSDEAFDSLTGGTAKIKHMTHTEILFRQVVSDPPTTPATLNDLACMLKQFLPNVQIDCEDDGNITIITNLKENNGFLTSI